jgi:hypothetical protein
MTSVVVVIEFRHERAAVRGQGTMLFGLGARDLLTLPAYAASWSVYPGYRLH